MSYKKTAIFSIIFVVIGLVITWQWDRIELAAKKNQLSNILTNSASITNNIQSNQKDTIHSSTNNSVPSVLPEYFRTALIDKKYIPKLGDMPPVEPWIKQELINQYKGLGSLTNKMHIVRLLTYIGGDDVVEVFANAITNEFNGMILSKEEALNMSSIPMNLGILSAKSDNAYQFLTNASNETFWQEHCKWSSALTHNDTSFFTGYCIMSVGISGRKEAMDWYNRQKMMPTNNPYRTFVTSGVYHLRMIKTYGMNYIVDTILPSNNPDNYLKYCYIWMKSPEGKEWSIWSAPVAEPPSMKKQ